MTNIIKGFAIHGVRLPYWSVHNIIWWLQWEALLSMH